MQDRNLKEIEMGKDFIKVYDPNGSEVEYYLTKEEVEQLVQEAKEVVDQAFDMNMDDRDLRDIVWEYNQILEESSEF